MGVYTHFGSKQGLLEQLYLYGFRRLEDRLSSVASDGEGRQELVAFALAYRAFALDNEALYGLMFERATPDFAPSDASRMAGLATFEMLATRVRRRTTRRRSARSSKRSTAASDTPYSVTSPASATRSHLTLIEPVFVAAARRALPL